MAPRVMPMRPATTLGEVWLSPNISRITTHSATVTPLRSSLRAKACETWLETNAHPEADVAFQMADGRICDSRRLPMNTIYRETVSMSTII